MMKKKMKDERIIKETNKVVAPMFPIFIILTGIVMIIKYFIFESTFLLYSLEITALIASLGYLMIRSLITGIPILRSNDDYIKEIQRKYYTQSAMICFWIYVVGEFILMLLFPKHTLEFTLCIPIWFIPSVIITVYTIKNGLLLWGSKQREETGLRKFRRRTVFASLFFGVATSWDDLIVNGQFQVSGILWVIGMAIFWGIPMYFIMKKFITIGEKNANKAVETIENKDE